MNDTPCFSNFCKACNKWVTDLANLEKEYTITAGTWIKTTDDKWSATSWLLYAR